ncbi:serine/threonine-protein kinase grp [Athalia rosae]|uniref:serine/threonine-protein kinase grp n=1 Tax=Athalia rosae TaxID=37344 RepID=UPI000625D1EA|nr:serine/threonine-protein kinase grp [Athalia rosae]XP_012266280.1 serine/threonine-protein kinase grp [Athalia rosae]XP_012266282.1 serine/threonine-protein kinase grp [Athalia rosae]XP_048505761.1 serine/threonine-protein kinase grp [Athalia rosae]
MSDFVEGWTLGHTLGEGAYGEVKLVINTTSGEAVAMKMIDLVKHPNARQSVRKETTIHRMLSNPHIIHYFGQRSEATMEYIFLEYAAGGELFDRIEPDIGMPAWEAQKYFKQLVSAVEYLHSRGVAHRDLKPENLLLDEHDNLKVTDFGMATVYRLQGKERCLDKRCGTLPYVAPEVLSRPYHAEPADVWSCGIILVAMLAGELPWDQPLAECPEYLAWKDGKYMSLTPWSKLDNASLSLVRKALHHLPESRYTLKQIKEHRWMLTKIHKDRKLEGNDVLDGNGLNQMCSRNEHKVPRLGLSQPEFPGLEASYTDDMNFEQRAGFSFSQPTDMEDLLLCTQLQTTQYTQNASQNILQKLVRRMTRFFVKSECDNIAKKLVSHLEHEGYTCRISEVGVITVATVDRRKMPLVFKANIVDMDGKILVDFRLSKGCGIEFKRRFVKIKTDLGDLVEKGAVSWPIAVATHSMP